MVNATGAALPVGWGVTVGLTAAQAIPANPSRQAIMFVNASGSSAIAICPAVVNLGSGPAPGVPVIGGAGSITMSPGDKFIVDTLNCTTAWNAISNGASAALTILES
jgi:hypothetical protein